MEFEAVSEVLSEEFCEVEVGRACGKENGNVRNIAGFRSKRHGASLMRRGMIDTMYANLY